MVLVVLLATFATDRLQETRCERVRTILLANSNGNGDIVIVDGADPLQYEHRNNLFKIVGEKEKRRYPLFFEQEDDRLGGVAITYLGDYEYFEDNHDCYKYEKNTILNPNKEETSTPASNGSSSNEEYGVPGDDFYRDDLSSSLVRTYCGEEEEVQCAEDIASHSPTSTTTTLFASPAAETKKMMTMTMRPALIRGNSFDDIVDRDGSDDENGDAVEDNNSRQVLAFGMRPALIRGNSFDDIVDRDGSDDENGDAVEDNNSRQVLAFGMRPKLIRGNSFDDIVDGDGIDDEDGDAVEDNLAVGIRPKVIRGNSFDDIVDENGSNNDNEDSAEDKNSRQTLVFADDNVCHCCSICGRTARSLGLPKLNVSCGKRCGAHYCSRSCFQRDVEMTNSTAEDPHHKCWKKISASTLDQSPTVAYCLIGNQLPIPVYLFNQKG